MMLGAGEKIKKERAKNWERAKGFFFKKKNKKQRGQIARNISLDDYEVRCIRRK